MIAKILRWSLMIVLLLSVLSPVAAYFGVVAVLILAIQARKSRHMLAELSADTTVIIMLFCILLSVIYSKDKLMSIGGAALVCLNIGLYLVLAVELKNIRLQRYCSILDIACLLACAYGIYQFASGNLSQQKSWVDNESYGVLVRVYSTLLNPNIFATFLSMNLSFGIARLQSFKKNKLLTLNIILASVCLLLTYSRGGFAAFFSAMLVLCLFKKRKKGVVIYLMAMTAAFAAMNSTGYENRVGLAAIHQDSSSLYRFEIWRAALNMFLDNPIFGHGIGTTWYYLSGGSDKLFRYILHSHNIYLQVATELGIAGLAAFVSMVVKKVWEGYKLLKESAAEEDAQIIQGFIACIAGIVVHGLVDAVVFVPAMSLIFMGYFALYDRVVYGYRIEPFSLNSKSALKLFRSKCTCEDEYQDEESKAYQA